MGMLCSLDLMFKKKIIFLFLLLFSSIVIFGNTNNQTLEVCKYFKGGDSKKKFNPYTGKTNIPFKKATYMQVEDAYKEYLHFYFLFFRTIVG